MSSYLNAIYQANWRLPVQRSNTGNSEIQSTAKHSTPEEVRDPPALIAVIGWWGIGKTTFVNSASGSCLRVADGPWVMGTCRVQMSNEFELDGQRVVLIDSPGFSYITGENYEKVVGDIKQFLAETYPTGTKLAGVVFLQPFAIDYTHSGRSLSQNIEALKELCGDTTLKNVIIMTHSFMNTDKFGAEQKLNSQFTPGGCFHPAIELGAQVYCSTGAPNPDLGALRIILRSRPVTSKVQQEPINEDCGPKQIAPATELNKEYLNWRKDATAPSRN